MVIFLVSSAFSFLCGADDSHVWDTSWVNLRSIPAAPRPGRGSPESGATKTGVRANGSTRRNWVTPYANIDCRYLSAPTRIPSPNELLINHVSRAQPRSPSLPYRLSPCGAKWSLPLHRAPKSTASSLEAGTPHNLGLAKFYLDFS